MTTPDGAIAAAADNAGMVEVETAVELFERRCRAGQSTVVVFYRGERSFFCKQWLRRWLAIPAIERRLELAGVAVLFVSSQSQGKAYSVAAQIAAHRPALDPRVFFFGDPEHLLVSHLGETGFAQPVVTNPDTHRAHGWVFDYGMVQPAVLAIAADGSVLYQWVSKPSILNVAGKLDRPDPFEVWDTIERRLDRIRISKARAARARAAAAVSQSVTTDHSEGPVSDDLAIVKAQPSLHSLGDVQPAPAPKQDAREEKSDSELTTNMSRKTSDRSIIRTKDRQPSASRSTEVRAGAPKVDQEFLFAPGESTPSLRRNPESDGNLAPLSTNIETFTNYAFSSQKALSKEEPDVSDGDIASIPVTVLSSNINALASEVLAENTMSLELPNAEPAGGSPGIAKRGQVERIISGPLTEDFVDEFEDIGDTKVVTDDEEDTDEELAPRAVRAGVVDAEMSLSSSSSETNEEQEDDDEDMIIEERVVKAEEAKQDGTEEDEDESKDETFSADEFNMESAENEFVGSTKSTHESRIEIVVEPPTQRHTSELFEQQKSPAEDSEVHEMRNSPVLDSFAEPLEAKVPSVGSDHIDTSLLTSRFDSVRTEDSTQANALNYGAARLSPDRRIVEEADDKKTGISDFLRELKDPEKRHYRVRGSGLKQISASKAMASGSSATGVSEQLMEAAALDGTSGASAVAATAAPLDAPFRGEDEGDTESFRSMEQNIGTKAIDNAGNSVKAKPQVAEVMRTEDNIVNGGRTETRAMPETETRAMPETDSPHPELHAGQRSTIDVSPFADADHNINTPGDQLTKPVAASLQDEYEAYDEYIVCEFEVEEYVEEYDSDTTSRSRVFVTAVVDEESHATSLAGEARTVTETDLPTIDGTRRVQTACANAKDIVDSEERAHVRIAETAAATIPSDPAAAPGPLAEKDVAATGGAMGSVRSVLRRFTIPIFSVARFSGSRQHAEAGKENVGTENDTTATRSAGADAGTGNAERDVAKLSRKDTIKAVLRKKPTGTFYSSVSSSRNGTAVVNAGLTERGETGCADSDEHTAKLGRKETLKSVLRKIPVPKTRKRQHTAEGMAGEAGRQIRGVTDGGEGGRPGQWKGGLQAVLQRLPSLSASGSRTRPAVVVHSTEMEVSSKREVKEYVEADNARQGETGKRDEVKVGVGEDVGRTGVTWGSTVVKEVKEKGGAGEEEDFVTADGTEGEEGREAVGEAGSKASETPMEIRAEMAGADVTEQNQRQSNDEEGVEDEVWGGSGRAKESSVAGMTSTPRAREGDYEAGKSGGRFSRTLSRLRGSGVTEEDAAGSGAPATSTGTGRAEEEGEDARKIRWKKTKTEEEEAAETGTTTMTTTTAAGGTEAGGDAQGQGQGEKVGAKKSFALVGGRILSRFRMS